MKHNIQKTGELVRSNSKCLGIFSLLLLLAALLGPLATAQATDWGFTLIGAPKVWNGGPTGEYITLTGAGTFNPEEGTASGGGAFSFHNAFDEISTGLEHGTWEITGFGDFSSAGGGNKGQQDGTLLVEVTFHYHVPIIPSFGDTLIGILTVDQNGIKFVAPSLLPEHWTQQLSGRTLFHIKGP